MSAKDRRSHDHKRKAKLAKRAERAKRSTDDDLQPYEGRKYQAERWVPQVSTTELAVYEVIVLSERRLTNAQVKEAFVRLIFHLRDGLLAPLPEGEPEVQMAVGREVEFVVGNIRRHWRSLFAEVGPVSSQDLIGILRTLLYSIEAHAWNSGSARGYVAFLEGFFRGYWPARDGLREPGQGTDIAPA